MFGAEDGLAQHPSDPEHCYARILERVHVFRDHGCCREVHILCPGEEVLLAEQILCLGEVLREVGTLTST